MTVDWMDIVVTVLTAGVFSLIGFVWRFSHKVTKMEQTLSDNQRRIKNMEADHDKAMDRLYSMNKQRSEYISRGNNNG